jgi:hypothetical protein
MSTLAVLAPQALAHAAVHPIQLTGLRAGARMADAQRAPLIVERRDQDFVEGLLADLGDITRHAALRSSGPLAQGGVMRLFQPLQRVFNMLVLEAFCEVPGEPRVDPKKIDSSGFVLRRVDGNRHLAWLKAGTQVVGWEAVDEDLDPSHDRRPGAVNLGHPWLNARAPSQQKIRTAGSARLAASTQAVSEDVQPLFVAGPDVCDGVARTLLFGTLRVASGELTEAPKAAPLFGSDEDERTLLRNDLVSYLVEGGARSFPVPALKRSFTTQEAVNAAQTAIDAVQPALTRQEYDRLDATLGRLLLQLNNEFDAFGTGVGALALQAALKQLNVETDVPATQSQWARIETRNAYDFLLQAKAVWLDANEGASVTLPDRWGAVSSSTASAIFDATLACLQQQFAKLMPASGRFESGGNGSEPRFVVRAFIRVKPEHAGCSARLVWSQYSAPFTIAPWFESSGAPVPVIPMPDLMDRAQLQRIKPSVAFALPPRLAKLLRSDAKELRDGKGDGGDGLGLGWICSFSLPIITLCAFIVLNIFLTLFNLIFFWLPFLKICIPIPKAKE